MLPVSFKKQKKKIFLIGSQLSTHREHFINGTRHRNKTKGVEARRVNRSEISCHPTQREIHTHHILYYQRKLNINKFTNFTLSACKIQRALRLIDYDTASEYVQNIRRRATIVWIVRMKRGWKNKRNHEAIESSSNLRTYIF